MKMRAVCQIFFVVIYLDLSDVWQLYMSYLLIYKCSVVDKLLYSWIMKVWREGGECAEL